MKTGIPLLAVFIVLFSSFPPQSSSAMADVYDYTGRSAQLNYYSVEEDGCVDYEVWVFAGEEMVRQQAGPRTASSRVLVTISHTDYCGTVMYRVYGSMPLSDANFQIDRQLNSATLTVTVPVSNWDGSVAFDAHIDLTWTGISPLGREDRHSIVHYDGYHLNQKMKGDYRYAEVSGTVSDGITNFTPRLYTTLGLLYNAREGSILVEPNP